MFKPKEFMEGVEALEKKGFKFTYEATHKLNEEAQRLTSNEWIELCETVGGKSILVTEYRIIYTLIEMINEMKAKYE